MQTSGTTLETLVTEAEEAAYQNRTKDMYSITKRLAGKFAKRERPVRDKNGGIARLLPSNIVPYRFHHCKKFHHCQNFCCSHSNQNF
ncbi:hypothetical protein DPMN_151929 [Dreissena polymorpha]|uniref:Uncharacterized protein n=1 Tax=Dreissena polymorpha TaxID=45954 RepID=A0A9D4FI19_DREPO|nr:hypothetical protein DPMN_151929 [Dreissena polymorpha]